MATQDVPIPSVVAMLVCDKVITEAGSNKKTLVGIFNRWHVPELPFPVPEFWVYARLTDAEGTYVFKVRFVYLTEDSLVAEVVTNEITLKDRLEPFDLAFPLPKLPIGKPGRYEAQLYANDIYIGRTTMLVMLRKGD